jgi:hypothetical protein
MPVESYGTSPDTKGGCKSSDDPERVAVSKRRGHTRHYPPFSPSRHVVDRWVSHGWVLVVGIGEAPLFYGPDCLARSWRACDGTTYSPGNSGCLCRFIGESEDASSYSEAELHLDW